VIAPQGASSPKLSGPVLVADLPGFRRFDLLRLFEQVARRGFGLSSTTVALIRDYVLKSTAPVSIIQCRVKGASTAS
jgi:hypothetical protein